MTGRQYGLDGLEAFRYRREGPVNLLLGDEVLVQLRPHLPDRTR